MEKYLNQGELAAAFGVPRQRVAAWLREGCPCFNVVPCGKRKHYRFSLSEVAAWLREREQAAAPDAAAGEEVAQ